MIVIFPQYAMSWPKTSSQVKPTPWWSGSQTRQRKISHLMFVPWKWPSLGFPANEALDDTGGIQRKRLQTIASQHGNPFVCTMTKPSMYLHMLAPWYLGKIDSHDIWARLLLTHITLHEKTALITRLWLALLWLDIIPSLSSHIPIYTSKYIKYYLRISQYFKISKWVHCTWGRGWMTKASGVGERRKGRGELRRDCHHRVAALFVPTRMQQWYIDIWYITMIYMGEGAGGGPFAGKITWCPWGAPEYVLKQ